MSDYQDWLDEYDGELSGVIVEDVLDIVLEDDDSDFGGISHMGEDVEDFALDADIPFEAPVEFLNEVLANCGIRPLDVDEIEL